MSARLAACNLRRDELRNAAFDVAIVCPHCDGTIPSSAALTFDGNDYVWHFCGHDCLALWCDAMLDRQH